MVVVDTNILAYLFIEGDRNAKAKALLKIDSEWHSDVLVFMELTNVLVSTLRTKALTVRESLDILEQAEDLIQSNLHAINHVDALLVAHEFQITAYDARFISLARKLNTRLVTEDLKLRKAAPNLTQSLDEAIGHQ